MVADRHLADPDHRVHQRDVAADGAGEGAGGEVIPAGPAPGGEALRPETIGRAHHRARGPHRVVGAEEPDDRGDAAAGEALDREGRNAGAVARLAAAAGQVDVAVDQPRDDPAPLEVVLGGDLSQAKLTLDATDIYVVRQRTLARFPKARTAITAEILAEEPRTWLTGVAPRTAMA